MAERCDKNLLRVAGIDEYPRNLARVLKADVRPGLAAIHGLVHAVSVGDGRAHVRFAGAQINDLGIGWRNSDGADGSDGLRIKNGIPGAAGIVGAPHAATHRAEVENLGLTAYAGNRQRPAAAKGSNRAPA